jgi:hypothetical protein
MACHTPQAKVPIAGQVLFSPQSFGRDLMLNQQLIVTQAGKTHALDVLLEISTTHIRLAGFSAGHKVMTFAYDGQRLISDQHPFFPKTVNAASILESIELTFWPLQVLQQQLPHSWSVIEKNQQRKIYRQGILYLKASYDTSPRWNGKVQIISPTYQYQITLQSKEVECA